MPHFNIFTPMGHVSIGKMRQPGYRTEWWASYWRSPARIEIQNFS